VRRRIIPPDDPRLLRARATKERHKAILARYANVHGVGVGFREVAGKPTDEIAIRVYVRKKVPKDALAPRDVLPREIDGFPVDVIEARIAGQTDEAEAERTIRHSVLKGGVSIGNLDFIVLEDKHLAGTLGSIVFDDVTGQPMLLTNWHVICGRPDCPPGEAIIQPLESKSIGDLVARLARAQGGDTIDAAVAFLSNHRFATDEILGLGRVSRQLRPPTLGLEVAKSGRTTGVTFGTIDDVDVDITITFDEAGLPDLPLKHQIQVKGDGISDAGDSGSVFFDEQMRPVGLLTGGDGSRAIANPIEDVARELRIHFGPGVLLQDEIVRLASPHP